MKIFLWNYCLWNSLKRPHSSMNNFRSVGCTDFSFNLFLCEFWWGLRCFCQLVVGVFGNRRRGRVFFLLFLLEGFLCQIFVFHGPNISSLIHHAGTYSSLSPLLVAFIWTSFIMSKLAFRGPYLIFFRIQRHNAFFLHCIDLK